MEARKPNVRALRCIVAFREALIWDLSWQRFYVSVQMRKRDLEGYIYSTPL